VHELYAEIGRLTTELGWLKKKLVSSASRNERRELVEWESDEISISRQTELLSLNRSSLYYQPVGANATTVKLRHRIDEIYTATPFYGYRRITAQLRREGQVVSHKAVARHMHEMGLAGIVPGPNLSKRYPMHPVYPYLLRGLKVAYPNHVWGIDITYIRLHSGWMYLVAVLDWYSRYVVSWVFDQALEIRFVLVAVEKAPRLASPVIWNSDQGSHFTSP
jgi:putative transposase